MAGASHDGGAPLYRACLFGEAEYGREGLYVFFFSLSFFFLFFLLPFSSDNCTASRSQWRCWIWSWGVRGSICGGLCLNQD